MEQPVMLLARRENTKIHRMGYVLFAMEIASFALIQVQKVARLATLVSI
jgi:hypothetical protein